MEILSECKCYDGRVYQVSHKSEVVHGDMKVAIYVPDGDQETFPSILHLSGLTCTDQNFITKSGVIPYLSKHKIAIICPDTSPRNSDHPNEHTDWDFGSGAGFYVNATQSPWSNNYHMYDYINKELRQVFHKHPKFKLNFDNMSIMGHSMGGHGALISALKGSYRSCSAFAPICHPMECPWGKKAFSNYLGSNEDAWKAYDATVLAKEYEGKPLAIWIDQGLADKFYVQEQLRPEDFQQACRGKTSIQLTVRYLAEYDHSFYFITTVLEDHIAFHLKHLSL